MAPDCVSYGNSPYIEPPIAPKDCVANLQACYDTPLGSTPGGSWGHTVCTDCNDVCRALGKWPQRNWYRADCRWWRYTSPDWENASVDAGAEP
ncbi:hypothetical protein Hoch_4928 [Haliangium ochraceum DSM 14365]|uniref:Uncharacterized protein n=2 Tax=Haliangium ochraceum TaxID=80816 RepID=D0LU53_HALO1|nr:hypothetical protein Hoch_4928 [Haliangium ochraceum DSM 14365]